MATDGPGLAEVAVEVEGVCDEFRVGLEESRESLVDGGGHGGLGGGEGAEVLAAEVLGQDFGELAPGVLAVLEGPFDQ